MKISGLKIVSVKDWRMADKFTSSDGRVYDIAANQKVVCMDECGDICNLSIITDKPLNLAVGKILDVKPISAIKHNSFGWEFKAELM